MAAFAAHPFDRRQLRQCDFPVFFGYGDETGEQEEVHAAVLARLLPDVRVRRFAGVHHFVPAERVYSPEHVTALRTLWS